MRAPILLLALAASLSAPTATTGAYASQPYAAQPVPRVDEAKREPALFLVRNVVLEAARKRDLNGVLRYTTPDSRRMLTDELRNSSGWDELIWVLENGGRLSGDEFDAPYTLQANYATSSRDVGVVVGEKVPAHEQANDSAPIVQQYSHEVIKVTNWRASESTPKPFYRRADWIEVNTRNGKSGFMRARFVRAHTDYRVFFQKLHGTWQLAVFTTGE